MTTAKQGFIDACRELATADPNDRMEFKTVIAAERGLHCSQPDCPRFAMARVYRPTDGPNTRVGAIAALLTGDLVSELRCTACAEAERVHVIDHLCPCGESARYDAILTREMSREVVSHYPSGLWNLNHTSADSFTVRMCGRCLSDSDVRVSWTVEERRPARRDRYIMHRVFEVFHTLWTHSRNGYFPSISTVAEVMTRDSNIGRYNHVASVLREIEDDAHHVLHGVVETFREDPRADDLDFSARVVSEDIDDLNSTLRFHRMTFADSLGILRDLIGRPPVDMGIEDAGRVARSSRRMLAPTSSALRGARKTLQALRDLR